MTNQYRITVDNDDGTTSEHLVDADKPLGVTPGQVVDQFTSLLGGVEVFDDVIFPNWHTEFLCFVWAIARLNPEWEVGRLLGAGITTTRSFVQHGTYTSALRGGSQIDVRSAGIGSSITIQGTVFTFDANPTAPTEWNSGPQLARSINRNLPGVMATYSNGFLFLRTRDNGFTNVTLATFTVVTTGLASPTRFGGEALAPVGQFNVESSPATSTVYVEAQGTVTLSSSFFPDYESLRPGDSVTFAISGNEFTSRIVGVNINLPGVELVLDPVTRYNTGILSHPQAVPVLLESVSVTYRRLPRLDDSPLFFMDEPIREQTDRFIQEIYDYLKNNTFGVKVDQSWLQDQTRLNQLTEFLDRVRAVETNWIACSELDGVEETLVPFIIETTPSDGGTQHFDPLPAFLTVDQTYLDTHYLS